jgi:hypothetical protein
LLKTGSNATLVPGGCVDCWSGLRTDPALEFNGSFSGSFNGSVAGSATAAGVTAGPLHARFMGLYWETFSDAESPGGDALVAAMSGSLSDEELLDELAKRGYTVTPVLTPVALPTAAPTVVSAAGTTDGGGTAAVAVVLSTCLALALAVLALALVLFARGYRRERDARRACAAVPRALSALCGGGEGGGGGGEGGGEGGGGKGSNGEFRRWKAAAAYGKHSSDAEIRDACTSYDGAGPSKHRSALSDVQVAMVREMGADVMIDFKFITLGSVVAAGGAGQVGR